jgi:excinuclease ABC subunit C
MTTEDLKKSNLPDTPGVYFFLGPKKEILYIGKATSLRDRVKSYFNKDLILTRGPRLVKMVEEALDIKYLQTDSVLEALMVEASQIKKHQPPYNTIEKDDRSYNYVVITKEDYPRVLVMRGRELYMKMDRASSKGNTIIVKNSPLKIGEVFGPFPHGTELRQALKILRKIFPYRDEKCTPAPEQRDKLHPRPCFNAQIGLCPGVCTGRISKREYRKIIKHLTLFFRGEKDSLVKDLEKDMHKAAKDERFEDAERDKKTLYALDHIQDVALIRRDTARVRDEDAFRIEAYDIAHISGSSTVGVMVVVEGDELAKDQYRKFRIRGTGSKVTVDDTKNLKEVIERRLGHLEWPLPSLIVIDGGVGQLNAAKEVLSGKGFKIDLVSVVKDNRHKAKEIIGKKGIVEKWNMPILLANSEAHRFAITYHRKLQRKGFRI